MVDLVAQYLCDSLFKMAELVGAFATLHFDRPLFLDSSLAILSKAMRSSSVHAEPSSTFSMVIDFPSRASDDRALRPSSSSQNWFSPCSGRS